MLLVVRGQRILAAQNNTRLLGRELEETLFAQNRQACVSTKNNFRSTVPSTYYTYYSFPCAVIIVVVNTCTRLYLKN